ncbi:type IV secretory system conjugative DNA transfer family protein [Leifsonia aquatica]|uniref:type IV secretory system conjugative DNA transfer family protein n=1 Tax=Leifsonia aquatica TaxID=144185 RepID=UPI00384FCB7A
MKPDTKAGLEVALLATILVVSAHIALAVTATGVPTFTLVGAVHTIAVVLHLLFNAALPAGVQLGSLTNYLAVFLPLLGLCALGWWGAAVAARKIWPHRSTDDQGLLTNQQLRRQNKRDMVLPEPFAFIGGKPFYATKENSFCMIAMSGTGKTVRFVVQMVARAAGACVTTSTRLDVFFLTAWVRAKKGRALTFAPEYRSLLPWKWRVHWDIIAGCESTETALERADAIANAMPLGGDSKDSGFFKESASLILRCMMHAAALGMPGTTRTYTMRDVIDWMQDSTIDTPYTILREHPNSNRRWFGDLKTFARGDATETRNNMVQTVTILLKALAIDEILDAVCPAEGVIMLDLNDFLSSTDTLYLMSKKKGLAAPVITALVESLQSAAMDAGEIKRLDPILTFVLDELCNVCPLPSAPGLMTDGRGHGIQVAAILQGRQQCVQRFGNEGADTIINLSSCLLLLGGSRDIQHLREISELAGKRDVLKTSTSSGSSGSSEQHSETKEEVFSVQALRELEEGKAIMLYSNLPAVIVEMPGHWEGADADIYATSLQATQTDLGLAA